jgi:hypothetical protein
MAMARSYRPDSSGSAASCTWKVTRSANLSASAFALASAMDSSSRSKPSTRAFGYARAMEMLDHPVPQPMSATRAGGSARSRSWTSGTAGSHSLPIRLTNIARLAYAMPSRMSAPYSV